MTLSINSRFIVKELIDATKDFFGTYSPISDSAKCLISKLYVVKLSINLSINFFFDFSRADQSLVVCDYGKTFPVQVKFEVFFCP